MLHRALPYDWHSLQTTMASLSLINLPHDLSDRELREWIESRGIQTKSIRIVRGLGTAASTAIGLVELSGSTGLEDAVTILHGKRMRYQTVLAKKVA